MGFQDADLHLMDTKFSDHFPIEDYPWSRYLLNDCTMVWKGIRKAKRNLIWHGKYLFQWAGTIIEISSFKIYLLLSLVQKKGNKKSCCTLPLQSILQRRQELSNEVYTKASYLEDPDFESLFCNYQWIYENTCDTISCTIIRIFKR